MSALVKTETILIVDDDVSFCMALRDAFKRRGSNAVVAHTVADALSEAKAWTPSRVVVDLRIADESGLEVIAGLATLEWKPAIVVLTGYGSITTAVAAMRLGALHYLTKPADVDAIWAAFETATESVEMTLLDSDPAPLRELEREHMLRVLADNGNNISKSARVLGIDRRTLQRRLARIRQKNK